MLALFSFASFHAYPLACLYYAQIDKALYSRAVAAADSAEGAAPVPERPSIRLRTRLNGTDEWKWKVPLDDTFDKVSMGLVVSFCCAPGASLMRPIRHAANHNHFTLLHLHSCARSFVRCMG